MKLANILISELHKRHFGLQRATCQTLADAARVALSTAHPGYTERTFSINQLKHLNMLNSQRVPVTWKRPSLRDWYNHLNDTDSTEQAAIALCIAAVENTLQMTVLCRAPKCQGSDYLMLRGPTIPYQVDTHLMRMAIHCEVSGTQIRGKTALNRRLRTKLVQVRKHRKEWIATVCSLGDACIAISHE